MNTIARIFEKLSHGLAISLGPNASKWTWNRQNRQFSSGPQFARSRSPKIINLVERLANNGLIIELACGNGILSRCINPCVYSHYQGFDISNVAIVQAQLWAMPRCEFHVCDMVDWIGAENASLIVIEEALYYLRPDSNKGFFSGARVA